MLDNQLVVKIIEGVIELDEIPSHLPVIIDNGSATVLYASDAVATLTGASRDELLENGLSEFLLLESMVERDEGTACLLLNRSGEFIPVELVEVDVRPGYSLTVLNRLSEVDASKYWPALTDKEFWHSSKNWPSVWSMSRLDWLVLARFQWLPRKDRIRIARDLLSGSGFGG